MFLLALVFSATGCFKTWTVIKASGPPSALQGKAQMAVQFESVNVRVGNKDQMTEQEWLDSREKDEHRDNYTDSMSEANRTFMQGLRQRADGVEFVEGQAAPGQVQMTVSWIQWEEGMWATELVKWPSEATARVIFTLDGETLDEIEVRANQETSMTTADPRARFRTIGKRLGGYTWSFLKSVNG
ncbi:hypothetical protein PPSIR1_26978 [Plesiocystis pacifica SIR-1]|uniref:Uncharacterized protein n=1 Tax=Plesiocystis pacifica SIR-1 TaxID=391625 RepID=A6GD99_9BACT|nr:hypothetical protein [Plesiocystis pacifica]EDM76174.1 hypothetical protein PPSIR1_26978 [Plesiocystis pacifica SIR-1]